MTNTIFPTRMVLTLLALTVLAAQMAGQAPRSAPADPLFENMAARSNAMFGSIMGSYGQCDVEKFGTFLAEDVEFFHDKDGLITPRQSLLAAINNVCGKLRRELVAGSLEVHPIPGYGAIEAGSHRFYRREEGSTHETGGTVAAKYLHVWQHKDGQWKITRVISYAH